MRERRVERIVQGRAAVDGAGVRVHRVFGVGTEQYTDPFLLLDDVGSDNPDDYTAGFPLHPHRGLQTVTYMLSGFFRHTDSRGNTGMLGPGCLQWMTAGSGVIHEEMPLESATLRGFQIWVNLPRNEKGRDPSYREIIAEEVPIVPIMDGKVHVLSGSFGGARGPVIGITGDPIFLDAELRPGATIVLDIPSSRTVLAYVFEGALSQVGGGSLEAASQQGNALLMGEGDCLRCTAGDSGSRLLLLGAEPLREPIAWKGPIVMNKAEEVDAAYREYSNGTFVKIR